MNALRSRLATYTRHIAHIDWALFLSALSISLLGLVTMFSYTERSLFIRQIVWVGISVCAALAISFVDFRFLRRTSVVVTLYIASLAVLLVLFLVGTTFQGAQSWFDFGLLAFQPSDPIKLVTIIVLAKYFTRRHVEIAQARHVLVSGFYVFIIFLLVFLQPDFGSAVIIGLLWLGMVFVSGISKKHLAFIFIAGGLVFAGLWGYVFQDYQKDRIVSFINPLTDIQGTGYNAYQSTIAVGSGQVFGKGVGFGTQSKLQFLPEYETDFIFAAFAEEWGFTGTLALLALFAVVIWRTLRAAYFGSTNFETLFSIGVAILFMAHIFVHVGMNIGLLPVTGTTLPFMSYGGSHLLTEFVAIGIVMGMRRYRRAAHKGLLSQSELPGV